MAEELEKKKTKKRSAAKTLQILERGHRIVELRKNGVSLRSISRLLIAEAESKGESTRGYSYEQIRKDYHEILDILHKEQIAGSSEMQTILLERLEDVYRSFAPHLATKIDPITPVNLVEMKKKAGDVCLKAINEMATLTGANKPLKHELNINVSELTDEELEAIAKSKS